MQVLREIVKAGKIPLLKMICKVWLRADDELVREIWGGLSVC